MVSLSLHIYQSELKEVRNFIYKKTQSQFFGKLALTFKELHTIFRGTSNWNFNVPNPVNLFT